MVTAFSVSADYVNVTYAKLKSENKLYLQTKINLDRSCAIQGFPVAQFKASQLRNSRLPSCAIQGFPVAQFKASQAQTSKPIAG